MIVANANSAFFQIYPGESKVIINKIMMGVCFVLDQQAEVDFYSASSLIQLFADRHVAPLRHVILFPSQSVVVLTP